MMYYTVTEGRARALDQLNLRDRETYGVNWMVFEATSPADAVRQWERFKAGNHVRQAQLEREAASYRAAIPGYAAPWEAETEAVVMREAAELPAIEARSQTLREEQAALEEARQALTRLVKSAAGPTRRATPKRRRRARAKTQRTARKRTTGERRKPAAGKRKGKSKSSQASGRRRQRRTRTD